MPQKTSKVSPKLLIHSGTHGDEWGVINLVKEALEKYKKHLPLFEYVSNVSPSAVSAKTRLNGNGNDINRIFFSDSKDPEVIENIHFHEGKKFDLLVTFHEDLTNKAYYVYDNGKGNGENKIITNHNKKLKEAGIKLLNGIDDGDDPILGHTFIEGYKKFVHKDGEKEDGMIDTWLLNKGVIRGSITPEIPGKLSTQKKRFIVNSFFEEVLLKWKF